MSDIYDFPLDNFPSLIAKLIRQRVLKIVKKELEKELEAKGFALSQVPACYIRIFCEAYFEAHRAECIRVASDTVRIAAGLYQIAEREAHQRAMARAVLSLTKGRDYDVVMGALPKTDVGGA
jgi:hypothetical protein